jgi:hypothetical protein
MVQQRFDAREVFPPDPAHGGEVALYGESSGGCGSAASRDLDMLKLLELTNRGELRLDVAHTHSLSARTENKPHSLSARTENKRMRRVLWR